MNEQWFWETKGELFGPLATSELEGLISAKKIRASDRLKLGEKGEWLSGTEVMELVGTSPASSSRSTAQSADDVLHDMHRRQVERLVAGGEAKISLVDQSKKLWSVIDNTKEWCVNLMAGAVGMILSPRGKVATIAACSLIVCLSIIGRLNLYATPPQEIYETLTAIRNEAQSLQQSGVDEKKWQEFKASVQPVLDEVNDVLTTELKTMSRGSSAVLHSTYWSYQAKRCLHQLSKYDYPRMLNCGANQECFATALEGTKQHFQQSEKCLMQLNQLTFANNIDWRAVAVNCGIPSAWVYSTSKKKNDQMEASNWDPTVISIVIIDVLFVAGILWMFRKNLMFWKTKPVRT